MTFTGLRSLLVLPLLLAGAPLAGQTTSPTVTGIVTDTDGRPLATALVAIVGTHHRTHTDSLGHFTFDSLPIASVTLRGMQAGYHYAQLDSVRLDPARTTRVELWLRDMGPNTYCAALTFVTRPLR